MASLASLRRKPSSELTRDERRQLGEAVLKRIRKTQLTELLREVPDLPCPCASKTWHSDGSKILAAIRDQHLRRADTVLRKDNRTDREIMNQYENAMDAKRAREAMGRKEAA